MKAFTWILSENGKPGWVNYSQSAKIKHFLVCCRYFTGYSVCLFFSFSSTGQVHQSISRHAGHRVRTIKQVKQHSPCVSLQEAKCGFVIILMALYWCTECIPLAVTALLPVILFPMMGIMESGEVFQLYTVYTYVNCHLLELVWALFGFFFPFPGLYPVPKGFQHAVFWRAAGGHRCRAVEPAQKDRPSSSPFCRGEAIFVRSVTLHIHMHTAALMLSKRCPCKFWVWFCGKNAVKATY